MSSEGAGLEAWSVFVPQPLACCLALGRGMSSQLPAVATCSGNADLLCYRPEDVLPCTRPPPNCTQSDPLPRPQLSQPLPACTSASQRRTRGGMCKEKHLKYNGMHTKELPVCLALNLCLVPHSLIPAHGAAGDRVTGAQILKDSCRRKFTHQTPSSPSRSRKDSLQRGGRAGIPTEMSCLPCAI